MDMLKRVIYHMSSRQQIFLLVLFLIFGRATTASGQEHTTYDITGAWEDSTSWIEPGTVDYDGNLTWNSYYINGDITRNGDLVLTPQLYVTPGSKLTVTGSILPNQSVFVQDSATLIVYGDLSTSNVYVKAGATLVVYGTLTVSSSFDVGEAGVGGGNVIVMGDYNAEVYTTIHDSSNLLVTGDINFTGTWFAIDDPPDEQIYMKDGTFYSTRGDLPVNDTNVGRFADLQANDPDLYAYYLSLLTVCPGSALNYSVVADSTYDSGTADHANDTFNWTVTGGTILTLYNGSNTVTVNASSGSITLGASPSTAIVSADIQWVSLGYDTIFVQQISDGSWVGPVDTIVANVADSKAPTITAPADTSVFTDVSSCSASGVSLGTPVTSDDCSIDTVTNDAPSSLPLGVDTVTWTVTDYGGNTATDIQLITVTDSVKPTITAPADIASSTDAGVCTASIAVPDPAYGDNCTVDTLTWVMTGATTDSSPASGINQVGTHSFNKGVTTITWTVTDGSSNTATDSMTVTVTDDEKPKFDPVFVYGDREECATDEVAQDATLTLSLPQNNTDNCSATTTLTYQVTGVTTVASTTVSGATVDVTFNEGISTVEYRLDDGNGNINSLSFTVTIDHKPDPGTITTD